jgi:Flp pilus assembly protein TadD
MPIVTAVVFSMLLLTVTGCVTASDPSAAKQETGKKDFSSFSGEGPGFESQPAHHFGL